MRKPVVLITGAGGEIGHGLVTRLAASGSLVITRTPQTRMPRPGNTRRQLTPTEFKLLYTLALDRAGVTHHAPQEMLRLAEDEVTADAAIRDAQRELRHLAVKQDARLRSEERKKRVAFARSLRKTSW